MSIYTMPKSEFFGAGHEDEISIRFTNNKRLQIEKNEIVNVGICLCDNLAFHGNEIYFVCGGGIIECELDMSYRPEIPKLFHASKSYEQYVENYPQERAELFARLQKGCKIDTISVFNRKIIGNMSFGCNGNHLVIRFAEHENIHSDMLSIDLPDMVASNLAKIEIGFENCFSCPVFPHEIVHMDLQIDRNLFDAYAPYRHVTGGVLELCFDKTITERADSTAWGPADTEDCIERICCHEDGTHDICNLYTHFKDTPEEYETIIAGEIAPKVKVPPYEYYIICGYAKRLENGNVLITFGENAKELLDNHDAYNEKI